MKLLRLYCEGTNRSHDFDILQKIKGNLNVDIQPIGSKIGAAEVIQNFENDNKKADAFLFFRDRDFDVSIPVQPALIIQNDTIYSYRTTIENYLLDTNLFFEFLKEKKLEKKHRIRSLTDAQNAFTQAAKRICYYQALRHTIAQFRLSDDLGTSWLKGNSGSLPSYLDNKTMCRQKAFEFIKERYVETEAPSETVFDAALKTFCNRFDDEDFYKNEQYLVWFQGKDLAKALTLLLPHFPLGHYYRFVKKHFDYRRFEDLTELRKIIERNTEGVLVL
jgi:Protein of unknown function (DUF4435)